MLSQGDIGLLTFGMLPAPVAIVDACGLPLALNPRAEQVWSVRVEELGDVAIHVLLQMGLFDENEHLGSSWEVVHQAVVRPGGALVLTTGRNGRSSTYRIFGTDMQHEGQALTLLFAARPSPSDQVAMTTLPDWAQRDPVTGLETRAAWSMRSVAEQPSCGVACMIDVCGLKEINDTYGHAAGDRLLAAVGTALAGRTSPGDAAVRYGGDEFLCVMADADLDSAQAWATQVDGDLAAAHDLPETSRARLSWGFAPFTGPATIPKAIEAADEDLYASRGTLLKAASGARLLTRSRRATMVHAARGSDDRVPHAPERLANHFGPEFGAAFQRMYRESLEQAQAFVDWVDPSPGIAAVEVGAGTGRITLDAGLAARIGPTGQLLVTDPSSAQLDQVKARSREFPWLHFAQVPADDLPLASSCADLVLGAYFLHLCQPPKPTVRELARVLHPGGRLALAAVLSYELPPFWLEVVAPVRDALAHRGQVADKGLDLQPGDLGRLCESVGLVIQQRREKSAGEMRAPDPQTAWTMIDQGGHLALFTQALPPEVAAPLLAQVRDRLYKRFDSASESERAIPVRVEEIIALRPA